MCHTQTPAAASLEKNIITHKLENSLNRRALVEDVKGAGILIDQTPEQYDLEKNINGLKLKSALEATNRPSPSDLKDSNIMVAKNKDLEKAINTDTVKAALEKRPAPDELQEGLLKTPHEAKKGELESSIAKDYLEKKLTPGRRPTVNDITAAGILKDAVRDKADSLSKELAKDSVKKDLSVGRRSSLEDLKAAGIIKSTIEEGAAKIETEHKKKALNSTVGRRPSMQAVGDLGILQTADVVPDAVDHAAEVAKDQEAAKVQAVKDAEAPPAPPAPKPAPAPAAAATPPPAAETTTKKGFMGLW